MRARLQRRRIDIGIALVVNRTEKGKPVSDYVAWLGNVPVLSQGALPEPEALASFWPKLDKRLREIATRDPRLTRKEAAKVRASLQARLAPMKAAPASARASKSEERSVSVTA
jgi:hypothetical protein